MRYITYCLLIASSLFASSAQAATWRLFIPYVDDTMTVSINGVNAFTCNFGQTCDWDLTSRLVTGANTITLKLTNTVGPYSYGFVLYRDTVKYAGDICGIFDTYPSCNANTLTGTVMSWTFKVVK